MSTYMMMHSMAEQLYVWIYDDGFNEGAICMKL